MKAPHLIVRVAPQRQLIPFFTAILLISFALFPYWSSVPASSNNSSSMGTINTAVCGNDSVAIATDSQAHVAAAMSPYPLVNHVSAMSPPVATVTLGSSSPLPPLEKGMINVTARSEGIHLKGLRNASIVLPVYIDTDKIPGGYSPQQVYTYWYDATQAAWIQLKRDSLDLTRHVVYSTTSKDGDYVNAIIQTPEMPEAKGYIPTTIKDLKIGDPAAMISVIPQPIANSKGDAALRFHIEVPKGRRGLEPNINLNYSSDGGNGMLGEGWSLTGFSNITLDSRRGVPQYHPLNETETYMLDGQMLAYADKQKGKSANFYADIKRADVTEGQVTRFSPRKEREFQKILRLGDKPENYTWEITHKNGTKYYYGAYAGTIDESSMLRKTSGKYQGIAQWNLIKVVDVYGNSMDFRYRKETANGQAIYPIEVDYTLHNTESRVSFYRIQFFYGNSGRRDNTQLSARLGFVTNPTQLTLDSILVLRYLHRDAGEELVRKYSMHYKEGAFNKLVLKKLSQYGDNRDLFCEHDLRYYNEDKDQPIFSAYKTINVGDLKITAGIKDPLSIVTNTPTAIGGSRSSSTGGSMYVGVGPGYDVWSVNNTVGIQYNNTAATSNGLSTMIDIDGDALPDRLFVKNDKLWYSRNIIDSGDVKFDPTPIELVGVPTEFYKETSRTTGWGARINFYASVSYDRATTESITRIFFIDANGDGLIDFSVDGAIAFNTGKLNSKGQLEFTTLSSQTDLPINGAGAISTSFVYDHAATTKELIANNPLQEVVKVWEAPYKGKVKIAMPVQLLKTEVSDENADGVKVGIESSIAANNKSVSIERSDFRTKNLSTDIEVNPGDRIFFRLQAGVNDSANGSDDRVNWHPVIAYVEGDHLAIDTALKSPNWDRVTYDGKADFLVSNANAFAFPDSISKLKLLGSFSKEKTMDSVVVQITELFMDRSRPVRNNKNEIITNSKGDIVYHYSFGRVVDAKVYGPDEEVRSLSLKLPSDSELVDKKYHFAVRSKVNIDLHNVVWKPAVSYKKVIHLKEFTNDTSWVSKDSTVDETHFITPYYIFNDLKKTATASFATVDADTVMRFYPNIMQSTPLDGRFWFSIKSPYKVLGKKLYTYKGGQLQDSTPLTIRFKKGDLYASTFESDENEVGKVRDTAYLNFGNSILETRYYFKTKANTAWFGRAENAEASSGRNQMTIKESGKYLLIPDIAVDKDSTIGNITVRIWKNSKVVLLGEQDSLIKVKNGHFTYPLNYLSLNLTAGDKVSVQYIYPFDTLATNKTLKSEYALNNSFNAELWMNRFAGDAIMGPMYRGWGQFIYNGMAGRFSRAIDNGILQLPASNAVSAGDINRFTDAVTKAEKDKQPILSKDPSFDKFSAANIVFSPMIPIANASMRAWMGGEDSIYLTATSASTSRLGIDHVLANDPFKQFVSAKYDDQSYGRSILKLSKSTSNTYAAGAWILTGNYSTTKTEQISDLVDFNGDRFPDIKNGGKVQLTDVTGKLTTMANNELTHTSENEGGGMAISGSIPGKKPQSQPPATGKASSAPAGNAANAEAVDESAGSYLGASGGFNIATDNTTLSWVDINGDGLPDKALQNGYQLNLGYNEFDGFRAYGLQADIFKSSTTSLSPGVTAGFSFDKRSFSGGAGLSFSAGKHDAFLQDMTADGLQDKVTIDDDGKIEVMVNTGREFVSLGRAWTNIAKGGAGFGGLSGVSSLPVSYLPGNPVKGWLNKEKTKFNASNGVSVGGSATFGFTAFIFPVKFVFNPGFSHATGLGRTIRQVIDLNGDGFSDLIYSNSTNALEIQLSLLGKTNKLIEVKNPLSGVFKIEYAHQDITTANPGGKWVMSELVIDDGVKEDRSNSKAPFDSKKTFEYTGGRYDRFEREFLGFNRVITTDLDFNGVPYRHWLTKYNTDYYHAGNVTEELVRNASDTTEKYSVISHSYYNHEISGVSYNVGKFSREVGIIYAPIKETINGSFEGTADILKKNASTYSYNLKYGYVEKFRYKEVNDGTIDYETTISYKNDNAHYIIGLPTDVVTKSKSNAVLRHTSASYYDWDKVVEGPVIIGQKLALKTMSTYLDNARKSTTTFKYRNDAFGNITNMIMPNGLEYQYIYDELASVSNTQSYITKITNLSFNFSSETDYDYRYGLPIKTSDINLKRVYYKYDNFGRIIRVIGPKECDNPDPTCLTTNKYTIKIDYGFKGGANKNARPATALVTHVDPIFKEGIQTINFSDGFARSVQVKKTAAIHKTDGQFDTDARWTVSGRVNYDAFGRAVENFYPSIDWTSDGLSFMSTPSSGFVTRIQYDLQDRTTKTVLPDGATYDSTVYTKDKIFLIATTYSPNSAKTSGGLQKRAIYTNGSDLKGKEVLYDNADTTISTSFTYDPFHQLIKVVDARKTETAYEYDPSGNRTKVVHPDGGTTQFLYDDSGRLNYKITAVGDTLQYKYNRHRLVKIEYRRHPENNVLYVYNNSHMLKLPNEASARDINACDRIIYQEDASGAQSFEYGPLGEITKTTKTVIAPFSNRVNTFVTNFEYDTWNRIKKIEYPDKEQLEYHYNRAGLLDSIVGVRDAGLDLPDNQKSYPYVKKITYDEFDQRTSLTYGNDVKTAFSYEKDRRRLEHQNILGIKAPSIFLNDLDERFSYDNQNNITKILVTTNNKSMASVRTTENFSYDQLNRLESAEASWTRGNQTATYNLNMKYDGVFSVMNKRLLLKSEPGNDSVMYNSSFYYDKPANHQLTRIITKTARSPKAGYAEDSREHFEYDLNGNNAKRATGDKSGQENTYSRKIYWDEENRINAVSMNGYVSHYVYDGSGERTIKLSIQNEAIYVNGKFAGDTFLVATFSLYANPYFSMRNGDSTYTKHIYIGHERIISQLENIKGFDVPKQGYPLLISPVVCPLGNCLDAKTVPEKRKLLNMRMNADFVKLDLHYEPITHDAFNITKPDNYEKPVNPYHEKPGVEPKLSKTKVELLNFFYHTNQVGSIAFVTDNTSRVVHCMSYLPFGEAFMELRQDYSSQFLFGGKEQDEETGLYYFGTRYYDPKNYLWLSVDPIAEKYPGLSPYNYCLNNPIIFRDPDGEAIETPWDVLNVGMDVASFAGNVAAGNYVGAGVDLLSMGYDLASTFVPGMPGGTGVMLGFYRFEKLTNNVRSSINKTGLMDVFKRDQRFYELLGKANNAMTDHLNLSDISGAMKDVMGKAVVINGKSYQHLKEVNEGLQSLDNLRAHITATLKTRSKLTPDEIRQLGQAKKDIENYIEKINGFIRPLVD